MPPVVKVQNLSKTFKNFCAVDDLSFQIGNGEVYGFLGQNGAGKSTTMRMLLGLIFPTAGEIFIHGKKLTNSSRHLLRHTGAMIERPDAYGYLSAADNLMMFGLLSSKKFNRSKCLDLLELVGLKGREKDKVKAYSQGMKQRLGIAIALAGDPDLLVLDEPTNGLDPQGIAEMRSLIIKLSKEFGKTILISSHLLNEIEQVADKMLILHKGKKIKEGVVKELLDPNETLFEIRMEPQPELLAAINESIWQQHFEGFDSGVLRMKMSSSAMAAFVRWLVENRVDIYEIKSTHSLEAYFLTLTNDVTHPAGTL